MNIAVGSANPVKRRAVERALADRADEIGAVAVESGVPEQPRGRSETICGAENRARRARASASADLGVGIEGGVAALDDRPDLYLIMWAAVTDGEALERGGGPTIRLPSGIAARVRQGGELGPVLDDALGTTDIKHGQGAAGVLTDGIIDRETALVQAVAAAAGPLVADTY